MRCDRFIIIAALAVIVTASGCVAGTPPQEAMDAANVTADRMLAALNESDYAAFTLNFSSTMKSAVDEKKFNEIKNDMDNKFGQFVSRAPVPAGGSTGGYNIFVYDCQFEKGNAAVQFTMNQSDVWTVEGFFYK